MKHIKNPDRSNWPQLVQRPEMDLSHLDQTVHEVIENVKVRGDEALIEYAKKFDGIHLDALSLPVEAFDQLDIRPELQSAIMLAKANIEKFHKPQNDSETAVETAPGVKCWRQNSPIEKVGLYIPGGSAPLFSTVLMLGVPAVIAGCAQIVLCTPPNGEGKIDPTILYTAKLLGIDMVFKVGGAQAIAAMAFGTESIPKVDKIFGPGNQYVTRAKELVLREGTAIDMPAGPSELLVIADDTSNPAFVAADLLSQAEHGSDSQVVLLTNDEALITKVDTEISRQIASLPRKEIAAKALENSFSVTFPTLNDCMAFSNMYAPEHLIINTSRQC